MRGMDFEALLVDAHAPTAEEFEQYKRRWIERIAPLCDGEEVLSTASFRQDGAAAESSAQELAGWLGGLGPAFLARKTAAFARKKRAGGLPRRMILAVTPNRLFVFDSSFELSLSRREREHGEPTEVVSWRRSDIRCAVDGSGSMSTLRIKPLDGGAPAKVVGGSIADDPWSLEVMALLDPAGASAEVG